MGIESPVKDIKMGTNRPEMSLLQLPDIGIGNMIRKLSGHDLKDINTFNYNHSTHPSTLRKIKRFFMAPSTKSELSRRQAIVQRYSIRKSKSIGGEVSSATYKDIVPRRLASLPQILHFKCQPEQRRNLSKVPSLKKKGGHERSQSTPTLNEVTNTSSAERTRCSSLVDSRLLKVDNNWPVCYGPIRKDSIADVELQDNQVQLTINHEPRRNRLTVSLHRAKIVLNDNKRLDQIFAKIYLIPGKIQKQKSKTVDFKKAMLWENDFVFKKLTIGQLETNSFKIKFYLKGGLTKASNVIGESVIALSDVNINDFETTVLGIKLNSSYVH